MLHSLKILHSSDADETRNKKLYFQILALEINYEDGALVDDFVDEYPAIRELDVDQEDDDQLLPEKVTRAAR